MLVILLPTPFKPWSHRPLPQRTIVKFAWKRIPLENLGAPQWRSPPSALTPQRKTSWVALFGDLWNADAVTGTSFSTNTSDLILKNRIRPINHTSSMSFLNHPNYRFSAFCHTTRPTFVLSSISFVCIFTPYLLRTPFLKCMLSVLHFLAWKLLRFFYLFCTS